MNFYTENLPGRRGGGGGPAFTRIFSRDVTVVSPSSWVDTGVAVPDHEETDFWLLEAVQTSGIPSDASLMRPVFSAASADAAGQPATAADLSARVFLGGGLVTIYLGRTAGGNLLVAATSLSIVMRPLNIYRVGG